MDRVVSKVTSFREFRLAEIHDGSFDDLKELFSDVVKKDPATGMISGIVREYVLRDEEDVQLILMYSSPEVKMNDGVLLVFDKYKDKYTDIFLTKQACYDWLHELCKYMGGDYNG